jgi:hypothetical protein
MRHYVAAACGVLLFVVFISPFELYSRGAVADLNFKDRVSTAFRLLSTDWSAVREANDEVAASAPTFEDYFGVPGLDVLNRLSRIRMDSNLIAACENYHYGFAAIKEELLFQLPNFLYRDKPKFNSADFRGRVSGVSADVIGNTQPAFTMISDSFGAFGWMGVIVTGAVILPIAFVIYESIFDVSRPWGTIALVVCVMGVPESGLSGLIAGFMIRTPIYLLLASYTVKVVVKWFPTHGDSAPQPLTRESSDHEAIAAPG